MAQSDNDQFWIPQGSIPDKVCRKCRQRKPLTHFYKIHKRGRRQFHCYCKACDRKNNAEYERKKLQKNPRYYVKKLLAKNFGMSLEEYDRMNEAQQGVCAICKSKCRRHTRLSVDHCHKTGKIRGLLCERHNLGISYFDESIEI